MDDSQTRSNTVGGILTRTPAQLYLRNKGSRNKIRFCIITAAILHVLISPKMAADISNLRLELWSYSVKWSIPKHLPLQSVQTRLVKIVNTKTSQILAPLNMHKYVAYSCLEYYDNDFKDQFIKSEIQTKRKRLTKLYYKKNQHKEWLHQCYRRVLSTK